MPFRIGTTNDSVSVDYTNQLGQSCSTEVNILPSECPACGYGIQAMPVYGYSEDADSYYGSLQMVFRCPRNECKRLFLTKYAKDRYGHGVRDLLELTDSFFLYPGNSTKFSEYISNVVSKEFTAIYEQSERAELSGLNLVAGPGYRKALEFLVKDYLIASNADQKDVIGNEPLGGAINRIPDEDIKSMAHRAAWIGNDETHYLRKWEDKDITDLKTVIELVVMLIDRDYKIKHYGSMSGRS